MEGSVDLKTYQQELFKLKHKEEKIFLKKQNKVSKMYDVWDYTKYEKFLKLMKGINPQMQVALANS